MSTPPWVVETAVPAVALEGPSRADVLILGAGPAAVAAAGRLRAGGAEVILLPPGPWQDSAVCHGPGVALPAMAEHYSVLVRDLGREAARRWWTLAVQGAASLRALLPPGSCDARRGGVLLLAADEAEGRELADGLRALGEDGFSPRMMGAAAASNYLSVDSDPGAMYLGGALTFDPARALATLVGLLQEGGVRILPPDPGARLVLDSQGARVETSGFEVRAELAVLGEGAPAPEGVSRRLLPLRGQLLTTGRLREGMTDVTVAAAANRGHEVYRSGPEGGLLAAGLHPGAGPKEHTTELAVDPGFQGVLEGFAQARFPEARRAQVTRRWASLYEFCVDGLPLVGAWPGEGRLHLLRGFGASPWSLAWGAGEALAAVLGGGENALPDRSSPRRFPS